MLNRISLQERSNYKDPVTDFLSCLYIDFDFEAAQTKLRECEGVLQNDFFLTGCLSEFRESARLLVFEMFCRIHKCISLEMLSSRLNMDRVRARCAFVLLCSTNGLQSEAERWIVDLIRNYRIDGAKIDSQLGQVVMGAKTTSIHEQVMESTKRLTFRTQQVALQLQKLKADRKVSVRTTWKPQPQSLLPCRANGKTTRTLNLSAVAPMLLLLTLMLMCNKRVDSSRLRDTALRLMTASQTNNVKVTTDDRGHKRQVEDHNHVSAIMSICVSFAHSRCATLSLRSVLYC